ncbi:thyroid receptor-interacting protein 13 [Plasmopara halstedii]|uniref:Thyroid receptor-interacting protein 13 n=1 Tax=Plasmopara halstedii TaxID=4781 RepID=A0A0P1AZ52_PLAHL|nr:thyroid receptor-interacting protein 13 [Plasmopara halstedii]CEG47385.1 thyroid receptor-interacting protein 13 [Plasmopara halstedii]|eukprot:XP_024583754.1 thyroid receptor-interacting protein 13 [Plasmopara halstedii]
MEFGHVHVEVCVKQESVADYKQLSTAVAEYLGASCSLFSIGSVSLPLGSPLTAHVKRIIVTELEGEEASGSGILRAKAHLYVHVYKLCDEVPAEETMDNEDVATCQQTILPAANYDGLWESLIFDTPVKKNILDYAMTAMLFSDHKVNSHIISWNRVVLLHGPPGTGKTSLCKALAQKLSIRLSSRYPNAVLLEVNAHSLFSKWFSESGKLVMKLFCQIQELVEDDEALICVLIDEVESLAAARKSAASGSDPSDAIRVVNALLTQLDSLKRHSNVLILTTSNITEAIDVAFIDRADIKQFIGLPTCHARYEILRSCIHELQRVNLLLPSSQSLMSFEELTRKTASRKGLMNEKTSLAEEAEDNNEDFVLSLNLMQTADSAEGFSGRALRKLPFQAHASFVQTQMVSVSEFTRYLSLTIQSEKMQKQQL